MKMHASNKGPIAAKKKSSLVTFHILPTHKIAPVSTLDDPGTCSLLIYTLLFSSGPMVMTLTSMYLSQIAYISNDLSNTSTWMSNKY